MMNREYDYLSSKYSSEICQFNDKCNNLGQNNVSLLDKVKVLEKENVKYKNKIAIYSDESNENQRDISELTNKITYECNKNEKDKKELTYTIKELQIELNKLKDENKDLKNERSSIINSFTIIESKNSSKKKMLKNEFLNH